MPNQTIRRQETKILPTSVWHILVCPACKHKLRQAAAGVACPGCGRTFPRSEHGQLDLRLTGKDKITLEFWLDHDDLGEVNDPAFIIPFPANPAPEVDFRNVPVPIRLDARLLSYFPRAQAPGALMLDLGCGACLHRQVCEQAGFTHVGLDLRAPEAPLWGDAHALPFAADSFEFILSIAVLEHLRYPFLGLREAWRVLQPGGRLVGTVAFLEPFHDSSFYHHTHLGLYSALRANGFEIKVFGPNADWLALRALAEMILFPKLPLVLSRALVKPLDWLHRLWWKLGERITRFRGAQESIRLTSTAGSFSFVVEKPKIAVSHQLSAISKDQD